MRARGPSDNGSSPPLGCKAHSGSVQRGTKEGKAAFSSRGNMSNDATSNDSIHPPVIIVAGLGRCGMSLAMSMLEAGGVGVGHAGPPMWEVLEAAPVPPRGLFVSQPWMGGIDAKWFESMRGQAMKLTNPHCLRIPRGDHRAIWIDRHLPDRLRSLIHHFEVPPRRQDMTARLWGDYLCSQREPARAALQRSGATLIDLQYEDLAHVDRCTLACKRIEEFLARPLERQAMAARVADYCQRNLDRDTRSEHQFGLISGYGYAARGPTPS